MLSANDQNFNYGTYDAAADLMGLYSYFFPIRKYFLSVNDDALTFHERCFKSSILRNFEELECEYQSNLIISFAEHSAIRPLRSLVRPVLKHELTLANAWDHMFDAFGCVKVFMAGLAVGAECDQKFNRGQYKLAKNRVLSSLRILHQDCLSFLGVCNLARSMSLDHAYAIVSRVDKEQVFN